MSRQYNVLPYAVLSFTAVCRALLTDRRRYSTQCSQNTTPAPHSYIPTYLPRSLIRKDHPAPSGVRAISSLTSQEALLSLEFVIAAHIPIAAAFALRNSDDGNARPTSLLPHFTSALLKAAALYIGSHNRAWCRVYAELYPLQRAVRYKACTCTCPYFPCSVASF